MHALSDVAPTLFWMALLLVGSAFFSGSETALFSLSRGTRERLARSELASDRRVVTVLRDPRRLLVLLLLGNEFINITFSSLAASLMGRLLGGRVSITVLTIVTTAITVPLILILGEVTPKSVAIRAAEPWARFVAPFLQIFAVVTAPLRVVVTVVGNGIVRLLGGGSPVRTPATLSSEDVRALVDAGQADGVIQAAEGRMIHRVFAFGERTAADIMTPQDKVFVLSYELPRVRLAAEVAKSGYSRVPIYRGRKRDIVGILLAKDLVQPKSSLLGVRTIKDLLRPAMYVPKTTKCDRLFREFQKRRSHIAIVVDEYGRNVGLVTMDDVLEEIFGEIQDEKEPRHPRVSTPMPGTESGTLPKQEGGT